MNMPGLTAESSLVRTDSAYRGEEHKISTSGHIGASATTVRAVVERGRLDPTIRVRDIAAGFCVHPICTDHWQADLPGSKELWSHDCFCGDVFVNSTLFIKHVRPEPF
jgi:hypothetical protein